MASGARRVVIVDDDPAMRGLLRLVLQRAGMTVLAEADDGLTGLDMVRAWEPNVVVLDWQMPNLDGLETASRLRAEGLHVGIVMYSSNQGRAAEATALAVGVDRYVAKSAPIDELVQAIEGLLADRSPHVDPPG